MNIKAVNDVFDIIQGHQITEEEIYNSYGDIPIFTGDNQKIGYVDKAIINEEDLPCISYPTKGQVGELFIQEKVFNANNTAVLVLKDQWKEKIDLYWAISYLSPIIKSLYNSRSGIGYIGKKVVEDIELEIPNYERQLKIGCLYKNMLKISKNIKEVIDQYSQDHQKPNIFSEGEEIKIKSVFDFSGGNNGLTKEFIYHNQPTNKEEAIRIYSGSTSIETSLGCVKHDADIKKEKGPTILVTRKGYAGYFSIVEDKVFAINDDAYAMNLKDEWKDKVNIRWFIHEYQTLSFNIVTSKSDNATFSKNYMEEQYINIPSLEVQNKIALVLKKYDDLGNELKKINSSFNNLISKQII